MADLKTKKRDIIVNIDCLHLLASLCVDNSDNALYIHLICLHSKSCAVMTCQRYHH